MKAAKPKKSKSQRYEELDKQLIKFSKRLNAIYKEKREMPLIPLKPPIQKGWAKHFKMRDDISRRADAKDLARILKAIDLYIYSSKPDFKAKKFTTKQREDMPHDLKHIPEKSWAKLQWPEHFKKWFDLKTKIKHGVSGTTYEVKGYFFKFPYMFESEVIPHMATHRREANANLDREEKEIEQFFTLHQGWTRLAKLGSGYRRRWDGDKTKTMILEDIIAVESVKEFETNYLQPPE